MPSRVGLRPTFSTPDRCPAPAARRDREKGRGGGIARHGRARGGIRGGRGSAMIRAPSASSPMGARPRSRQHSLGMVARRHGFDHRGDARRVESGQQHRAFDLRAGDGQAIGRSARRDAPLPSDGKPVARARGEAGAHMRQGRDHPRHRARDRLASPVKLGGNAVAGEQAHQQAGRGAAELPMSSGAVPGCEQPADADARDPDQRPVLRCWSARAPI